MLRHGLVGIVLGGTLTITTPSIAQPKFDHDYSTYALILSQFVVDDRVDYRRLADNRDSLDTVVEELSAVSRLTFNAWSREKRLAYWINVYNLFTLRTIVDHYPIQGSWFSLYPRNSIQQIDGAWDTITWKAGGQTVTLDEIEHDILRPTFNEPLLHFAINCAAVSCPPLRNEPYRADTLKTQLADSTRKTLAKTNWLRLHDDTLYLTAILDWFGEDFVSHFGQTVGANRAERDRAFLGLVATYGPREIASLAHTGTPKIRFLKYDWTLNDISER
ncbi:MAG: DUF547 domain-containing protein [Acidobacteriota bacterium]|nr:DUF547 domain-containing protein [Acidobacteriota bacterium]